MGSIKRSLVVALLGSMLAACGGPADPEELAEQVVSHLHDADFQGFMDNLVASPQEVLEACPAVTTYAVDQAAHQREFNECLSRADFGSVEEITQVLQTMQVPSACNAGVEEASDIKVTVVTKSAIYTFEIERALRTENGWKVTDKLKCPDKR